MVQLRQMFSPNSRETADACLGTLPGAGCFRRNIRYSVICSYSQVLHLKSAVSGVANRDPDFDAFLVIESETDHVPLKAQQHLWNAQSLSELHPAFERTERWTKDFAQAACRGLIDRFGDG